MREELKIDDCFVIGNVARFSDQKNHPFLLRVFSEIKTLEPKSVLLLIGRGEEFEAVRNIANTLGLADSVFFLGIRDDVPALLNAIDVFVLPSKYEGLPVTLIEVQANGLPAVVSDSVTTEGLVLPNCKRLSLSSSPKEWAEIILKMSSKRLDDVSKIVNLYDINVLARSQLRWYYENA